ncbi:MAG: hypoxanthine phosphoribosyltransferase [Clostridiales bacterium]|nr:hypoxanthine phosphoribosyltransferase [Clostridiales bacterium]
MKDDIKEVLLSEEDVLEISRKLGSKISEDYKGKDLLVIGILKGAVLFTSDLLKNISIPCQIDFMAASSYGNSAESSGVVKIKKDVDCDVAGKDVLIVEDIVDTGITLKYIIGELKKRKVNSVEVVALLDKPEGRKTDVKAKYIGFKMPNEFLVGYGLDYAEKYRNLPYIGILKSEVYNK